MDKYLQWPMFTGAHIQTQAHTHHRVFISLWGHLTDIMCSLDAYPNPNHQKLMPNPNP